MMYRLSLLLLASLPFQFALPSIFGWEVPSARLLAAAVITAFLVSVAFRSTWQLPAPLFSGALLSFLGISLASLLWAGQSAGALPKILFLFNLFPLVFVWHDLFSREPGRAVLLLRGLILGAGMAASLGIATFFSQFVFGVSETFHFIVDRVLPFFLGQELGAMVASYPSLLVNIDGQTVLRVTAFFPDPHVAAFFFGMCGFLALGLARTRRSPVYGFIAGLLFLADILSFSRGGYIGLFVGAMTYAAAVVPSFSSRQLLSSIGAVVIVVTIIGIFGQVVVSRFTTSFSLADTSSMERLVLWREALGAISQHPLVGVGIGNYLSSARPLFETRTPFYAHNLYLDIAVEIGVIGLVCFLAAFSVAIGRSFRRRLSDPLAPALLAALLLYLAHSVFETALFSLHVTLVLVFIFALSLAPGSRKA